MRLGAAGLVAGSAENLERVARALASFGAPENVVAAARTMNDDDVVYLGKEPVRVDILRRASGRPQDLLDVAVLERVRGSS